MPNLELDKAQGNKKKKELNAATTLVIKVQKKKA